MQKKYVISGLLACTLLANTPLLFAQMPQRPNIIHILLDDVGIDDIECFGAWDIKTPNIDKLAADGVKATRFYAPHATCTPTRAALHTGRYAARVNNGSGLEVLWPDDTTGLWHQTEWVLPKILKQQGYITALIGKWHLGSSTQYLPLNYGYDVFKGIPYPNDHGPERRGGRGTLNYGKIKYYEGNVLVDSLDNNKLADLPHQFVREVCRFIAQRGKDKKPFYLQYSNIETHTPYFVPRGFEGTSTAGAYGDAVQYADMTIGMIMTQLKESGLDDNTLVVLTSDNGPWTKQSDELYQCYGKYGFTDSTRAKKHFFRGGKADAKYENGVRVSFIARFKNQIPKGLNTDHIIDGTDLFTTFVKLAGAHIPKDITLDGQDIWPILTSPNKANPVRNIFFAMSGKSGIHAVTKGEWKLVVIRESQWVKSKPVKYELYNLKSDPREKMNLINQESNKADELKMLLELGEDCIKNNKPLPIF